MILDAETTASLLADADRTHRWKFADAQGRRHGEAIARYMRMRNDWESEQNFRAHCTHEIERHSAWAKRWFKMARLIQL